MKDFFIGGPLTMHGDKPFDPYPALVSNNFDNFAEEQISNPQMVRRVLKGIVSKEYKHFFIQWDSYNHLVAIKILNFLIEETLSKTIDGLMNVCLFASIVIY